MKSRMFTMISENILYKLPLRTLLSGKHVCNRNVFWKNLLEIAHQSQNEKTQTAFSSITTEAGCLQQLQALAGSSLYFLKCQSEMVLRKQQLNRKCTECCLALQERRDTSSSQNRQVRHREKRQGYSRSSPPCVTGTFISGLLKSLLSKRCMSSILVFGLRCRKFSQTCSAQAHSMFLRVPTCFTGLCLNRC